MENGTAVKLRAYGPQTIERIVVNETDTHVNVCLSEEWESARAEGRRPNCVGFHKSDIVQINE